MAVQPGERDELEKSYAEFRNDLLREADVSGDLQQACFFRLYAELAAENGDCPDLTYAPARREGARGYQVDGYAVDPERGELHLAICDFRPSDELQSLQQVGIETGFRRAERFVEEALKATFVGALEETSPAFEAAFPIYEHQASIKRVRVLILTNARVASRKRGVESKEIGNRTFTYNVLDFSRYLDILNSKSGSEPIAIEIADFTDEPLECIEAHTGGGAYASYLVAMPGELLARIYGLYGARLLEQNVRTYLQAKTKVNKGILETIQDAPEMFFAYNNGLTATAAGVEIETLASGGLTITAIENLQIVNGGQTTASILYAKDRQSADLSHVYVQMKLSVVDPDQIEDVVPNISRFANTQNRISEADFFASHPFHLEMEKISRRLSAPARAGAFSATKWFYERARGQYRDQIAYKSQAARQRFDKEYPKDQVVVKTDVSKYQLTFACLPHVVSQGAQKAFLHFAANVGKEWESDPDSFNEGYFKNLVAKAIAFRWTDKMIASADWYREDRGYKANIVTYTLAWLAQILSDAGREIDLARIWAQQDLDDELKAVLRECAPKVAARMKSAPPEIKNITEYAKRQVCWSSVSRLRMDLAADLSGSTVSKRHAKAVAKQERQQKRLDNAIDLDQTILELTRRAPELRTFAESRKMLSPKSDAALRKLTAQNTRLSPPERNALKFLLEKAVDAGFQLGA